ncbi:MAG: penicillin-binding protein 2 [Candidatus Dependentiae bacterium]|nr:penicillin-binding protein 2 [Candidatus Dependentiae bacterium]
MQQQSHTLNAKIILLPFCIMLGFMLIGIRLYYLQIKQSDALLEQSEKNCTRIEKIQSPRGNILDCSGVLLATNRPLTNVYWRGTGNTTLSDLQRTVLEKIATIIDKPLTTDINILQTIMMAEKKQHKLLLTSDLTFEQLSQLQEQFSADQNITIATHFKRFYPHKTFACHILGYLGSMNLEPQGKMGLEKMFEETLKGEHGTTIKKINSVGRNLAEVELKEALSGRNIETTIDIDMQNICEQIFPEQQAGTFIVMDPNDGAIVALVSRPNFDPNIFLNPINAEQWSILQDKHPFLNRAFTSSYPPGSIFKLVTSCAAIENGYLKPDSSITCHGYSTFCERRYYCSRRDGHGTLTPQQALAQSCNILFFDIARHIDIDTLAEYAHIFGLGEKTNICFPETDGLIPTSAWKKRVKGERWWPGETLSAAIGQSFLLVTPIQVACMISSIFTQYLVKPRILQEEPIQQRPLTIKKSTLDFLRQSMQSVVTKGTGIRISRVKDIEIYAKTSTAQISTYSKRELGIQYLEHGWFVAYLKYKNNPPLTIVVMAENVGSSRAATEIAKNFVVDYKKLMDFRKIEAEEPEPLIS